jgi:hypothetical protein
MLPAAVAIERVGLSLDPTKYLDVSFEPMSQSLVVIVGQRADAITLGTRIFVSDESFDDIVFGRRPDLVAHELAHVDQWRADGFWFACRYVGEYLRFRIVGAPHDAAYRAISYELAASAAEHTVRRELRP